ncbi:MAG TPA: DegV family protein [Acidimicrobiales bacterium]|nr:DegV family protein [Acidimicrobiales bacterium]
MAGIRIVTDSACDLPPATATAHTIDIVPLTVRIGDTEYVDRQDLTPKEFWAKQSAAKALPETAAPSPGAFEESFRAAATQGASGVVCVTLSSDLSATFQSAQLAAEAVQDTIPVRVIDSRTVTIAQGLLAIAGAEAAAAGKPIDEVVAVIEAKIPRMRVFAALDTLENLKKGGRIGAARAALGSMLSVKPLIKVEDGAVHEAGKQRTRARSLDQLIEVAAAHHAAGAKPLAVLHGDAPDIDGFVDKLCTALGRTRDDLLLGDVGSVVGTHVGARVIGVAYDEPEA